MTMTIKTTRQLKSGERIPVFGLGTWQLADGQQTRSALSDAFDVGYRHFDTAMIYTNERSVGQAIKDSDIPRSEIFVTTKLWNSDHGYDQTIRAFNESLNQLALDYIDLYLIHWPVEEQRLDTWRAMETLVAAGRVKTIGVSNYMVRHLKELMDHCQIEPAVNQIELHPFNFKYRSEVIDFCRANNIQVEAYAPLTKGHRVDDPKIQDIADKYSKTPAQILIRWALQHELVVIPKSARPDRILENASVFDFSISPENMALIDSFNEDLILCWDPTDTP